MDILSALGDEHLLGASIRDAESWRPWRALLAAAFGLPLSEDALALYQACTGRTVPPSGPAAYLWLVIGRRGGKSFAMALIAVFLAGFKDWRKYLSPGERAIVLLVAADREQAKILHRYCRGILSPPILQSLVLNVTANEIELKGGVTIEVVTRSYRSVRGRSVCVAVLDELAFWRDDDSANPDSEVLNAVRASMATFGGDAMVIAGSSPYAKRGVLWDAFRRWFGKDDAQNLVWKAETRTMNPTVSQSFIDGERERDPASALSEYDAEFRDDITQFVDREVITGAVAPGRHELPPLPGTRYLAFTDPSGGSSDSFTLAIAHLDKDKVAVLDAVRERRPPFSPEQVIGEYAALIKSYGAYSVQGDRYAGEFPRELFRNNGITYELSEKVKSDIYRDILPLLNSGRVELLDHPRLVTQLCGLERRTARGGRDSIDHSPGAHDDVANAASGAMLLAVDVRQPMKISDAVLQRASMRGGGCGYLPSNAQMPFPVGGVFQGSFSDRFGGAGHG
jgi:hypothetical protein